MATNKAEFKIWNQSAQLGLVSVVGKGRTAYLWIGDKSGDHLATLNGRNTLRKIAHAIMLQTNDRKEPRRAK